MIISIEVFIISLLLRALFLIQINHYSAIRTYIHFNPYSVEYILYIYM